MEDTANAAPAGELTKGVVLVVDDEFLGRAYLVNELLDQGFDVAKAASGDEAVQIMLIRRIDLVVTDRRMPGLLDGDALAHFIAEEYPEVPVLMMSAEWPAPERTAAIAEFFPKPVNLRAAVRLIGELLSANAGIVLPSSGWSASASSSVLPPTTTSEPPMQPELYSEISCPHCRHRKVEEMPTDACQFFYECEGCATLLRPKAGHCCVFCSYGSAPCPPIQLERQGDGAGCCGC